MCLLTLISHGIQQAHAPVAVRLEGAHAEFLGQGKSLAIVGLGLLDLGGLVVHGDLTEQVQGMGLVATLLVLLSEVEACCAYLSASSVRPVNRYPLLR
jgi:hypothetical protein